MKTEQMNTTALDMALNLVGEQLGQPSLARVVSDVYQSIDAAMGHGFNEGHAAAIRDADVAEATWDEGYLKGAHDAQHDPRLCEYVLASIHHSSDVELEAAATDLDPTIH